MNNQIRRPYFLTLRKYYKWDYPCSFDVMEQREGDSIEELESYAFELWSVFKRQWPESSWGCLIQENFLPGGDIHNYVVCYTRPTGETTRLRWYTKGYHEWINTVQENDEAR